MASSKHSSTGNLLMIEEAIRREIEQQQQSAPTAVPLSVQNYGIEEIMEVLDSLISGQVTMGAKVEQFEAEWAAYIGREHAIMVNSGSSANLAILFALKNPSYHNGLSAGDEVITTAIPWATTVTPIVQIGAIPVFVDVDLATYNIDVAKVEDAITARTRAIVPVHLLGNPVAMNEIMEIAKRHDLIVIEDACEAHGASIGDAKVGSFGLASTFSFFFSHHINTIEGGMIMTDDPELADLLRSTRAHGWIRDYRSLPSELEGRSDFQKKWLFLNSGFNLRPTELAGAFGIHQIHRLESNISHRRANAEAWAVELGRFGDVLSLPAEIAGTRHVWFGYPILVREDAPFSREDIVTYLEAAGIATRPIIAGNILEHPVAKTWTHRVHEEDVSNAEIVHRQGFMIGNHEGVDQTRREYVVDSIQAFLGR